MKTGYRAWTDEHMKLLATLITEGKSNEEIAFLMDRSVEAIKIRMQRHGLRPRRTSPSWAGSPFGNKRYWTKERTLEGLKDFSLKHWNHLPTGEEEYSRMKKGHMEWPTAHRVLEHYGSLVKAWEAVGYKVSHSNAPWTQEDDDFLLEHAGEMTLKRIGKRLRRSWMACKRRLYDLEAGRARDVSGHLSATQVAEEYNTSLNRVYKLIQRGTLPARKVAGGHYWRIDPEDCEAVRELLTAPKRTHTTTPPDTGDYLKRYGLRRVVGSDGKVHRVAAIPQEKNVKFKTVQWRDAS